MSAKRFLAMAMMMAAMSSGGMGMDFNPRSSYEPSIPEEKKILPGRLKRTIPKGCKITTVPIETKWRGYLLIQYVDIIYGSEKAKQKAIVKAGYEIKEYLKVHKGSRDPQFQEFDVVMELPKEMPLPLQQFVRESVTDCPHKSCSLNENGNCVSTNTVQCDKIPHGFNEDRS